MPGVSWLSRPSAPLGTVGVNNLPTAVTGFSGIRTHVFRTRVKRLHSAATPHVDTCLGVKLGLGLDRRRSVQVGELA